MLKTGRSLWPLPLLILTTSTTDTELKWQGPSWQKWRSSWMQWETIYWWQKLVRHTMWTRPEVQTPSTKLEKMFFLQQGDNNETTCRQRIDKLQNSCHDLTDCTKFYKHTQIPLAIPFSYHLDLKCTQHSMSPTWENISLTMMNYSLIKHKTHNDPSLPLTEQ